MAQAFVDSVAVWVEDALADVAAAALAAMSGVQLQAAPRGCEVAVVASAAITRTGARPAIGRARVVAVVADGDGAEGRRALASGADGVVFAGEIDLTLAATVHAVAAGQVVLPRALRQAVSKPALTAREKQIMALVVLGFSNREIADRLVLAESTVKSHLFSAFRRLGVRTRKEAVAMILDEEQGVGSGILAITQREART
jgi:DNA-binding NarL/FixJ family response regulator